ncbi:uncharacterized sulfatase [Solimonas aquatica]|uniref:Uncharacterized sulfatase n=1 Tax=Solimonas aquatica TaxID=489703 RepID=A0A1H8ZR34_9GAMM|nr:quinoprotein relay system zinc metallohydrolase 1 [Solimonas aquatica]SEP66835.1 uncharacterized sulfatase [Solimonas aquatica]
MRSLPVLLALLASLTALAAGHEYHLNGQKLADGVYVFVGAREHFSRANGGNIVNTGFIDTTEGAVVIDSGSSRLYGEQQRAWISGHSASRRIARVYITHAHPDHFLGSQAYAEVPQYALPATRASIAESGDRLSDNLYRLVGAAMSGTQSRTPNLPAGEGRVLIGGRALQLIAGSGHTEADLAVYDEASGTLFAGDLVFYQRTATTPNADIPRWLAALQRLEAIPYKTLVPGHGPVVQGPEAIAQTRDYLRWLQSTLQEAARKGVDLPELFEQPLPERFRDLALARVEFMRSAEHLYPALELDTLQGQGSH